MPNERLTSLPIQLPQLSPEVFRQMGDIPFPETKSTEPGWDQAWIEDVRLHWPAFRHLAIQVYMARTEPAEINLLPENGESLDEQFTLTKSQIREKVIRMRGKDLRHLYNHFEIGQETGRTESNEPVFNITRKQMLQLYIGAFAHKYLVLEYPMLKIEDFYPMQSSPTNGRRYEETPKFDRLDKMTREEPFRGGPLLNAR